MPIYEIIEIMVITKQLRELAHKFNPHCSPITQPIPIRSKADLTKIWKRGRKCQMVESNWKARPVRENSTVCVTCAGPGPLLLSAADSESHSLRTSNFLST